MQLTPQSPPFLHQPTTAIFLLHNSTTTSNITLNQEIKQPTQSYDSLHPCLFLSNTTSWDTTRQQGCVVRADPLQPGQRRDLGSRQSVTALGLNRRRDGLSLPNNRVALGLELPDLTFDEGQSLHKPQNLTPGPRRETALHKLSSPRRISSRSSWSEAADRRPHAASEDP